MPAPVVADVVIVEPLSEAVLLPLVLPCSVPDVVAIPSVSVSFLSANTTFVIEPSYTVKLSIGPLTLTWDTSADFIVLSVAVEPVGVSVVEPVLTEVPPHSLPPLVVSSSLIL